jgi:hypothetical protein
LNIKIDLGSKQQEIEAKKAQQEKELLHSQQEAQKKEREKRRIIYAKNKQKTIIFYIILFLVVGSIVFTGIYNAFIKRETPISQIVQEVNKVNDDTAFKEQGVQGYLEKNVYNLLTRYITTEGQRKWWVQNVVVTGVQKKSATIANVYFEADIYVKLEEGVPTVTTYRFFLPLSYDFATAGYSPAGELELYTVKSGNTTTITENPFLAFGEIEKVGGEKAQSAQYFVDNFFTMLYGQGFESTKQMYLGRRILETNGLSYVGIHTFYYYAECNLNGYNCVVQYVVKTADGLTFRNTTYLLLEENNNTWVIKELL